MATSDTRSRGRRFNLPTQQRRLRHLRSIAARNLAVRSLPSEGDVDVSTLDTYLTLHENAHSKAFFISEKIKGSLNPTWRSFNLQHIEDPRLDTAMSDLVVRVWRGKEASYRLILEWHVNLTGLVYIGDKLQQDGISYRQNTLVFGMFEAYYSQPSPQTPGSSSLGSDRCPAPKPAPGMTVDTATVRDSYGVNSLSRIQTVLRAIKQTQASVKKVRKNIEEKLSQSQGQAAKKEETEMLALRVSQLRSEVKWRTTQLQTEKETHETTQANIHQRDVVLKTKYETLARDKERLHDKKRAYFDVREDLIKTGAQLVMRRKQLISELSLIYPVQELDSGNYTICGVKLPNSEDFSGQDEIMVAVALGYTTHLVQMINSFLDVPLRYPMEHRGSRSRITDHIHDKLTEKDRDFPLYSKGKEKFQFNYGVYLLNKNIAQLRYYCGLGTTDLRLTLPNLKSLLELRLGVKFWILSKYRDEMRLLGPRPSDPATNSLTPSQHVPLPPNLGGPQKLTSNFNSRLAPRPELLVPDAKTPSRSESEDSKFEQMLQESTKRRREDPSYHEDGKSAHSTTPETSSSSPESPSQTGELLAASPAGAPPSGDCTPSGAVTPAAPTGTGEGEDLFKAAPDDDFFEIVGKESIEQLDEGEVMGDASEEQEQLELGQDALTTTAGGYDQNGGLHVPEPNYDQSSSPGSDALITARNDAIMGQVVRNKILEKPLTDGYIDSDVSSTEENINASYGSMFNKAWPHDGEEHTCVNNSDSEKQLSGEDDLGHHPASGHLQTAHPILPQHQTAPSRPASDYPTSHNHPSYSHNANKRPGPHPNANMQGKEFGGNLPAVGTTAGLLSSDLCDSDLTYPMAATSFKTRAMSGGAQMTPAVQPGAVRAGQAACFTRTVSPRQGHEMDLPTERGGGYSDDICERTDALSTTFSTFKVKFPSGRGTSGSVSRGMLDDALPSGGDSDH